MFAKASPLANERMDIRCPKGTVLDAKNAHFGVLSNEFRSFIYCHKSIVKEMIRDNGYQDCDIGIDWRKRTKFYETMLVLCDGRRECTIVPRVEDLLRYNLGSRMQKACDQDAYLYMQIPCLVPKHNVTRRKLLGLLISCISVFIFLFVQLTLDYVKRVQANRFVEWDVKTVSAADYTVEFSISTAQYEYFEKHYLDPSCVLSDIAQFKVYI